MTFEELKAKAKEMGIKFSEDVTELELADLVQDALDKANNSDENSDDDKDLDYWKNEAKKAFEDRDKAKKERRTLLTKLSDLEKKLEKAPPPEKLSELEEKLATLSEFRKQVEQEKEEEELKKKTEIERATIQHQKQVESLSQKFENELNEFKKMMGEKEEKLKAKESQISVLMENKLEKEIYEAAVKYNALSPSQLVRMLKSDFSYNEELDTYEHLVYDKGKLQAEFNIDERVQDFLKNPENANLVKADVNVNSMQTEKSDKNTNKQNTNTNLKKKGKYDPNDPIIKKKADDNGLAVEDYIDTLILRDEKLGKINKTVGSSDGSEE